MLAGAVDRAGEAHRGRFCRGDHDRRVHRLEVDLVAVHCDVDPVRAREQRPEAGRAVGVGRLCAQHRARCRARDLGQGDRSASKSVAVGRDRNGNARRAQRRAHEVDDHRLVHRERHVLAVLEHVLDRVVARDRHRVVARRQGGDRVLAARVGHRRHVVHAVGRHGDGDVRDAHPAHAHPTGDAGGAAQDAVEGNVGGLAQRDRHVLRRHRELVVVGVEARDADRIVAGAQPGERIQPRGVGHGRSCPRRPGPPARLTMTPSRPTPSTLTWP